MSLKTFLILMGVSVMLVVGSAFIGVAALNKKTVNKWLPREVNLEWISKNNMKNIYWDKKNGQTKYFHIGVFDYLIIWKGYDEAGLWLGACSSEGYDEKKCEENKYLHPITETGVERKLNKNFKSNLEKYYEGHKKESNTPLVVEWADLHMFYGLPRELVIEFLPKTSRALNTIWAPKEW